jgi:hypothetical protein
LLVGCCGRTQPERLRCIIARLIQPVLPLFTGPIYSGKHQDHCSQRGEEG